MRRRAILYLLLLLLLTGCWDRLEVNDYGMVMGMAVDKGKQERVRLTLFVARGRADVKGGEPSWVVQREAATLADAIRLIMRASSRRISLEHLRMILVGEEYARAGMEDLIDFAGRHTEVRLTTRLLLARGQAHEYLQAKPPLEGLMPEALVKLLEAKGGLDPGLREFLESSIAPTHSPWFYAALQRAEGNEQRVELGGVALFANNRLVEVLTVPQTRVLAWLLQNPQDSELSVPCPAESSKRLSVRLEKGRAKPRPILSGSQPSFLVRADVKAVLLSSECVTSDLTIPAERKRLEEQLDATLTEQMTTLIQLLQRIKADPVGFGKRLQLRYPAFFRQHELDWPQVWAKAPVQVELQVTLHHSSFLTDPVTQTRAQRKALGNLPNE